MAYLVRYLCDITMAAAGAEIGEIDYKFTDFLHPAVRGEYLTDDETGDERRPSSIDPEKLLTALGFNK